MCILTHAYTYIHTYMHTKQAKKRIILLKLQCARWWKLACEDVHTYIHAYTHTHTYIRIHIQQAKKRIILLKLQCARWWKLACEDVQLQDKDELKSLKQDEFYMNIAEEVGNKMRDDGVLDLSRVESNDSDSNQQHAHNVTHQEGEPDNHAAVAGGQNNEGTDVSAADESVQNVDAESAHTPTTSGDNTSPSTRDNTSPSTRGPKHEIKYKEPRSKVRYAAEASTGVQLDVRWGTFQSALAVFAAINAHLPRDIQPTPAFHGHFLERAQQHELRERYADSGIWEDGEPRDILIKELEHACLPEFLHERAPSAMHRTASTERLQTPEQPQQPNGVDRTASTAAERTPLHAHEHTHANAPREHTPFVFIQGQKGSGRTVAAAALARGITLRASAGGSLGGYVVCVSFFRSGGPFSSVLEHIRMEVAMQMRGAKAFAVCVHVCLRVCERM
jgi:hypothetical protein